LNTENISLKEINNNKEKDNLENKKINFEREKEISYE